MSWRLSYYSFGRGGGDVEEDKKEWKGDERLFRHAFDVWVEWWPCVALEANANA